MVKLTCIVCPNSCELNIEKEKNEYIITGNKCKRGYYFALNELKDPRRTICTTIKTTFKDKPRLSVKTNSEVPKNKIFEIMQNINRFILKEKIEPGSIVLKNVCNTGVDIITTDEIE